MAKPRTIRWEIFEALKARIESIEAGDEYHHTPTMVVRHQIDPADFELPAWQVIVERTPFAWEAELDAADSVTTAWAVGWMRPDGSDVDLGELLEQMAADVMKAMMTPDVDAPHRLVPGVWDVRPVDVSSDDLLERLFKVSDASRAVIVQLEIRHGNDMEDFQ